MENVIFKNSTWQVYEDGAIGLTGSTYFLSIDVMLEKDLGGDWYHNPLHMAEKEWVVIGDYLEAWMIGIEQSGRSFNLRWMATSIRKASK